ncbi:MAG: glycosyltransferase [Candidatus Aminicenantes bacterium]|nr:glycosyltransferase [Candidatus Aminicenantes bacterium]
MIAVYLTLLTLSGLAIALFAALTVAQRRGGRTVPADAADYPIVSLLKPIKGLDDDLAANLESYYSLDYPCYEILFAVDDLQDPCLDTLKRLQAAHPRVPTAIIATGRPRFENPKVHKLALLEAKARGRLFWVTDANIRVAPDALRRLVDEHLAHDAKIVFSPIRGTSSRTFASLMENTSLNVLTSGSILSAWLLGRRPILVGKSFLVDRKTLETYGGFGYFKDYLAEDFLLGEAFAQGGYRVSTNSTWVTNVSRTATPRSFYKRMSRWAKLRFHLRPSVYLLEILLNPIVLALTAPAVLGPTGLTLLAVATALKVLLEYLNFLFVNTEDRRRPVLHLLFPAAVVAKDLIFLAVYLAPFFSRRVDWRGGRIEIGKSTLILTPANMENVVFEGA